MHRIELKGWQTIRGRQWTDELDTDMFQPIVLKDDRFQCIPFVIHICVKGGSAEPKGEG